MNELLLLTGSPSFHEVDVCLQYKERRREAAQASVRYDGWPSGQIQIEQGVDEADDAVG